MKKNLSFVLLVSVSLVLLMVACADSSPIEASTESGLRDRLLSFARQEFGQDTELILFIEDRGHVFAHGQSEDLHFAFAHIPEPLHLGSPEGLYSFVILTDIAGFCELVAENGTIEFDEIDVLSEQQALTFRQRCLANGEVHTSYNLIYESGWRSYEIFQLVNFTDDEAPRAYQLSLRDWVMNSGQVYE